MIKSKVLVLWTLKVAILLKGDRLRSSDRPKALKVSNNWFLYWI